MLQITVIDTWQST